MKRALSFILSLMMIASAAALAVGAGTYYDEGTILYEDDFEEGKDDSFWNKLGGGNDGTGHFAFEDGVMSGYSDAKICQSNYSWDPSKQWIVYGDWPCRMEFTEWIDVRVDDDGIDAYYSGFWIQDPGDADRGYAGDRTVYNLFYFPIEYGEGDSSRTSFVRLIGNTPTRNKNYPDLSSDPQHHRYVYGELEIPGDPYFNIEGEPVKLGVRYGRGNITAYANGMIVGSYDYETIGTYYTPILLQNEGCYVEFDNYGLGTYEHNVKKMTRPADYALYEGKVTVMDGGNVAGEIAAAEDDELKIEAPKVDGRKFVRWESVSVGGKEVKDFEKDSLFYGITLGSLEDEKYQITMPNTDVVLVAVYEDDDTQSAVIPGNANGDEKLNAKDVTAIMKYLVGVIVKGFDEKAADFDGNGSINAKDVTKLMKQLVTNA